MTTTPTPSDDISTKPENTNTPAQHVNGVDTSDARSNDILDIQEPLPHPINVKFEKSERVKCYTQEQLDTLLAEKVREAELKAQLGMIEYYDQAPDNESCNWKGLLADNRAQIEYELEAHLKGASK